jgi:type IV pilus assembly protein PilM
MSQEKISFDIGSYNTKVILGEGTKNNVTIRNAFTFKTPNASVEDGQIINYDLLKNRIINILIEKKVKTKAAVFSIASTKAIMRELVFPYAKGNKLESMIPYELSKHTPITVDDYIIKYINLEEFNDENKIKKARVLVVALPKYIVKSYFDLCNELGLTPQSLTMHAADAGRFLKVGGKEQDEMTIALIDLGHSGINCSIIDRGKLSLNRIISTGLNDIGEKIEEAESIEKCLEEIKLVFRFYLSLKNGNKIDQVILLGGNSNLKHIDGYIEDKLDRPVNILRKIPGIKYAGKDKEFMLNLYFNAASALQG